jgi:hypothetical protein
LQGTNKLLYLWPSDRSLPAFSLYEDGVEAKSIFFYDAIDSTAAGLTNSLASVTTRTAIAHFYQQPND